MHVMERKWVAIQHRFPIAVFPAVLGYLGTVLLLRSMAAGRQPWAVLCNILFVPGLALLAFGVFGYVHKAAHRWTVTFDDLQQPAARGSLSAAAMSISLTGAWVLPWSTTAATVLIAVGIIAHLLVLLIVAAAFWRADGEDKRTCPAVFLPLVGLAVAAPTANALGYDWLVSFLMWFAIPGYLFNFVLSIKNFIKYGLERTLRPKHVIHLAPVSLIGIAAQLGGYRTIALVSLVQSLLVFVVVLVFAVRIVPLAWNPTWASFTFPVVAFINFQRLMAPTYDAGIVSTIAWWVAFIVLIPAVSFNIVQTTQALFSGQLAAMTNAALGTRRSTTS